MSVFCSICNKSYANKNSLRAHKHKYHQNTFNKEITSSKNSAAFDSTIEQEDSPSLAERDFGILNRDMQNRYSQKNLKSDQKREYSSSDSEQEQPKRYKSYNDMLEKLRLLNRSTIQLRELQKLMKNTLKRNSQDWSQLMFDIEKLKADVSDLTNKSRTQTGNGYDIERLRSNVSELNDSARQQRGFGSQCAELACRVSGIQKRA